MLRIALLFSIASAAYPAAPELTALEPRGAQRGKSITLMLRGEYLSEGAKVLSPLPATFTPLTAFGEPGSPNGKLAYLIELKPDAAVGAYPIRVETADGLSNILLFTVGAFPEAVEQESKPESREHSNDSIQTAEPITAPLIVNGTLSPADRDFYRVKAKQGERLVFEVEARRIGSGIDPVLTIIDAAGAQIARNEDTAALGVDSRIDVTFPRDGDYYATVQDARYSKQRQNFYRLKVAALTYADGIFPLGWQRGAKVDVEFFGGNLPAAQKVPVDLSALNPKQKFTPIAPPGNGGSLPFLFVVGDLPEKIEPPRPQAAEPVMLEPSTVMNGRISAASEVDRYKLAVSPGEHWAVELKAHGLGTSNLDGVVTVYDAKGRKLASAGDKPPRQDVFSLLSAGRTSSDPWLEFETPADAHEVTLTVEDLLQRGGAGFGYRLTARKQPADFELTVLEPYVNIPAKGSVSVNVSVMRHGFVWPIELSIPELDEDYVVQGGHLPAEWKEDAYSISRRGLLTITAKPDAKVNKLVELSVWGTGKTPDGAVIRRKAQCLGMITEIAGGTGVSDADDRENQSPFVAPWLGLDLPVVVSREESGAIETALPRVLRLVQGQGFSLKWNFKPRNPDAQPPEKVSVDVAAPAAAEIGVRRSNVSKKEEKYAAQGEFDVLTTVHTAPEKYDLIMFGESKDGMSERLLTPAITLDVVQGYRVAAPKDPLTLNPGAKGNLVGRFDREPEFTQPVTIQADFLPAHVTCLTAELRTPSGEYSLTCEADASAKPGEYNFQVTPASVVVGLDKREVPYKIPPVTAKLIISGNNITQTAR